MPKFKKSLDQLETRFDKWTYILKHLADLTDRPSSLQEDVFDELFEVAEIANFTRTDQEIYESSLKNYRDWYAISSSLREEGIEEGLKQGRQERSLILDRQRSLLLRLLTRSIGELPDSLKTQFNQLSPEKTEALNEIFLDFTELDDLVNWLENG